MLSAPSPSVRCYLQVERHPQLVEYVTNLAGIVFSAALPAPPPYMSSEWRERAEAAAMPSDARRTAS